MNMSDIQVGAVKSRKDFRAFLKLPWKIYAGDQRWVPPLLMDMKTILSRKKNPFFEHSDAELFLAKQGGEVVGRIAGIINNRHNEFHQENIGFFGFFECIDNANVAKALFEAVASWTESKGTKGLRGPANLTSNDTFGFLAEGFDAAPVIMMPYNPQYYLSLLEACGFTKAKDLYAYDFHRDTPIPERFVKFAEKQLRDSKLTFRKIDLSDFDNEVKTVRKIYNDAWVQNWGFVPMTEKEFEHLAKDLKPAVDPDIVYLAEVDGEPAGFSLALPDYNEILKDVNGRLFPFGIFKLLLRKKSVKRIRVITLGVRQKFQKKRGLAPTFYYETYERGKKKGYEEAEFSWILEDNVLMNRALEGLGARLYKKYRVYEKL